MSSGSESSSPTSQETSRWLKNLQVCRAELDACQSDAVRLRAGLQSFEKRFLQIEKALGRYAEKTKNPFKLFLSRIFEPGAMRRDRKFMEAELKDIPRALRELRESRTPAPAAPHEATPVTATPAAENLPSRRHVIISGTGRAGTTFLMELFTALGLDTGFQHYSTLISGTAQAGLERDIREPDAPYIVKNPALCDYLDEVLEQGRVRIDHAFIPLRDLAEAARSRELVESKSGASGKKVAGGFWDASGADEQQAVLARKLSRILVTLAQHDVPVTLLAYPRLVRDARYLYEKVQPILAGLGLADFETVFRRVARPELVSGAEVRPPRPGSDGP